MITRMDRDIGTLLSKLKEYNIDQKTLVIFTSDNGPHKEGGNDPEFFNANGPLRGLKRALYEGGIRVPTIARWPGKIPSGTVSDHQGYFGDIYATVCDLTNQQVPENLQSISLLPTLLGRGEQKKHDYLYWEFYEQGSRQAVRFGNWKAIREPMLTGNIHIYDLRHDLGEENDIAADNPEIVAQAVQFMDDAHVSDPNWKLRGRKNK